MYQRGAGSQRELRGGYLTLQKAREEQETLQRQGIRKEKACLIKSPTFKVRGKNHEPPDWTNLRLKQKENQENRVSWSLG